jgi:hypothetical protein
VGEAGRGVALLGDQTGVAVFWEGAHLGKFNESVEMDIKFHGRSLFSVHTFADTCTSRYREITHFCGKIIFMVFKVPRDI